MANFKDSPTFTNHDDYYTPKSAWEQILPFVQAKGYKKVWECFSLNSNEQSIKHLTELGLNVIGDKTVDFLNEDTWSEEISAKDYDIIISNPPYQRIKSFQSRHDNLKYKCIKKLLELDKPFIILMNSTNMFQRWSSELFEGKDIKFIFPSKKIEYDKYAEGGVEKLDKVNDKGKKQSVSFNSVYVTYKVLDKNEWI